MLRTLNKITCSECGSSNTLTQTTEYSADNVICCDCLHEQSKLDNESRISDTTRCNGFGITAGKKFLWCKHCYSVDTMYWYFIKHKQHYNLDVDNKPMNIICDCCHTTHHLNPTVFKYLNKNFNLKRFKSQSEIETNINELCKTTKGEEK